MIRFPTLYKKTSTGAIQFWEISVQEQRGSIDGQAGNIYTKYGQVDTESPQTTFDLITEGKNTGKKNATTALQQAEKEAKSRWEKQKKKGYVESKDGAQAGELDELIEGGVEPMLAHAFSKHGHKIKYPCYVQPKLDGIRCIAIVKDGKCTLWSRTRKPINSMPHIVEALESIFSKMDTVLDGELYNHDYRNDFEKIVSLVRQEQPDPNCGIVQYHIYDRVIEGDFTDRFEPVTSVIGKILSDIDTSPLRIVETYEVSDEDQVMVYFQNFRDSGYEGAMLRNEEGNYVNKRSYDLQKVKEFDDGEFDIIGVDEGRGKLAGHVGAFVCKTADGKQFLAKMSGDTERLRSYFNDHSLWQGKRLTVQYQGLTGKEGVPRFPVGIRIRDFE